MFQQNITSPTTMLSGYLQRLSASFGFNSTPTTFEFDIVTENDQTFDFNSAYPGKLLSFSLGNLRFGGIIQSWNENFGPNGKTYSVRAADPRLIFGNIPLILDGRGLSTGVVLDNYLNVFQYYGSPQSADSTKDGMTFSKIREFLSTTGVINAYGSKFQLQFTSGFLDASGAFNPSGIPYWYRINASETTLDQVLQQVSQDFGMDYYTEVDYSTFNPTGLLNTLYVKHIYRNIVSDGTDISGFVVGARNSGVLQSYRRGQELRTDPTTVVALGPDLEYWKFPQGSQIKCVWGRTNDGTIITTDTTDNYGIILLDHITGSGSQYIANTISVPSISITKSTHTYPPRITRTSTNINVSGYQANVNVMRAALFSQESWETALYNESPTFASQIGITRSRFLDNTNFLLTPTGIRQAIMLGIAGSGISDRANVIQELIKLVYDATKQTVEQYWGKVWLLENIETSNWFNNGSYDSSELIPRIEFGPSQFTWSEPNRGLPSGITLNHVALITNNNPKFKNEIGKLSSLVSIPNYTTKVDNSNFPYPVDLSDIPREEFIIDTQTNKLIVPINVEQYEKVPTSFLVSTSFPIQGITNGSGYNDKRYYYDFLRYMSYADSDIRKYNLIQNADDNQQFGLASPRPFGLPYSSDQYGFFVGIKRNENNFGGFIGSGNRPGGVRIIADESLAPWTYGSLSGYNTAGNTIVGRSTSTSTVIDSAELNIVGLPPYNLGDSIGSSSQVTNASCQFGPDGFSTNYSIRTFAQPRNQLSKVLFDRITNAYTTLNYQQKQLVKLKVATEEGQPILTPNQVNKALGQPKRGPTQNIQDSSFKTNIVIPAPSGFYLDGNNPTIYYV